MTVLDQPVTSYSDATPQVRVIADIIHMIDPIDTPLLDALGGLDSARSKFKLAGNGTKIEILEDEYNPLSDVAAQGTTITTNATVLTVTDGSIFKDGYIIQIDSEYMVVSAADPVANTLVVYSRSYGGTNATHVSTSTVYIRGQARLEGDDADYGGVMDITAPYNYTSIFQEAVKVTGTQQAIDQYGISDELAYQSEKKVATLLRQVELAAFHSVRAVGSASAPRSMGGLGTFITDNTVGAAGGIAKSHMDLLMEYIMLDGGNPDLLVVNPSIARDIKDLMDTSSFIRFDQSNTQVGMKAVTTISTQFGDLRLLSTRWCPTGTDYMLDSGKIGFYTLRPFATHPLAKTGDSEKGEVIGEFSLLVANDKAHGKITGITT